MSGSALEWMSIEILVFVWYAISMIFLMAKSRFIVVGIDQSGQFEPIYIKYMMNEIISCLSFKPTENSFQKHI